MFRFSRTNAIHCKQTLIARIEKEYECLMDAFGLAEEDFKIRTTQIKKHHSFTKKTPGKIVLKKYLQGLYRHAAKLHL